MNYVKWIMLRILKETNFVISNNEEMTLGLINILEIKKFRCCQ